MPEHDLGALIIRLRSDSKKRIAQHMGRAVFTLGLQIIGRSNPELAQTIHDMMTEKPYTSSGLMRDDLTGVLFGDVNPDDCASIRLTGLSQPVVLALEKYHQESSQKIQSGTKLWEEVDHTMWEVVQVEWDQNHLPGLCSYQILIDRHRLAPPHQEMTFRFISATTFRSQGNNMALPLPSLVFGSLVSRWQAFTQLRLYDLPDDQINLFIAHHILLSRHHVQTTLYRSKDGAKEIGFLGSATFELTRKSDYFKKHNPDLECLLQDEFIWFGRLMNLLADFAYYSGVGRKTTWGMGTLRKDG